MENDVTRAVFAPVTYQSDTKMSSEVTGTPAADSVT